MAQTRWIVALGLLVALHASDVAHAKRKPSTAEERAYAVKLAQELEAQPIAENAPEKRRWLINWYERVPDISVTVCSLLGPFPPEDHPYFSLVLVQSMFAGGAFMIEHPDQAKDQVAVQTAGMLGALKVYEALVKVMPDDRLPFLDELVRKRDQGTLGAHMRETVPGACK